MKIISNFIVGVVSVATASQSSVFQRNPHKTLAASLYENWHGVAKDIKRVQNKLKAEAHDGRKKR